MPDPTVERGRAQLRRFLDARRGQPLVGPACPPGECDHPQCEDRWLYRLARSGLPLRTRPKDGGPDL